MDTSDSKRRVKGTFWTVVIFYGLIAFEFFYMASPFAAYFYSAYQPGLSFLTDVNGLQWLTGFFLPHVVVDTKCTIVNFFHTSGGLFFLLGFVMFIIGAGQVYYNKLRKKGAVLAGMYKYIRHPQYLAFAICGLGLLLLWPRFIVVIMYVTLLFAYYFLARIEERECVKKFGPSYQDYQKKTGMFLPFKFSFLEKFIEQIKSRWIRVLSLVTLYIFVLMAAFGFAFFLQSHTIEGLYTLQTDNALYISVCEMEDQKLRDVVSLARKDSTVSSRLKSNNNSSGSFLNYVVPANLFISEIAMHIDESVQSADHFLPADYGDEYRFKIIYSVIDFPIGSDLIYTSNISKKPMLEVWVDLLTKQVTDIKPPPDKSRYENIPMPVF